MTNPFVVLDNCTHVVLGVDPGPWTGIVGLKYKAVGNNSQMTARACTPVVLEVSYTAATIILRALFLPPPVKITISYEPFRIGRRSMRSGDAAAGQITRDVCGQIELLADESVHVVKHSAAEIKEWASDERLDALNLYAMTKNYKHARPAARQAIFAAVWNCHMTDPMSKHFEKVESQS